MSPVRIAVVGAGVIGKRHIELIQKNNACHLAAICDPNPQVQQLADQLGTPFFQDHIQLLDQTSFDGAIIATPTEQHADISIAFAKRGIHLLVEKPITSTVEDGKALLAIAKEYNAQILVGHYRRFNPLVQKARDIIQSGDIGQLVSVAAIWALQKPEAYYEVHWRTVAGGGPILINLIHDIDNLRFICGEIQSLYAMTSSETRGLAVEDTVSVTLRFTNGAMGTLTASDATPAPWSYEATMFENPDFAHTEENSVYFLGSTGSLAFPKMALWHYADAQQSGWQHPLEKTTIAVPTADPLTAQLANFCGVIRGNDTPLVSGQEGLQTLKATLAIHDSAKLDQRIWL
ncbi:MAG: Gfo/Idh/MocA family oxidoreductase [Chloroflexota bacterium]